MESRPVTIEEANTRLKETVKRCSTSDLIRVTSACFVLVYVLALASALRLLTGHS